MKYVNFTLKELDPEQMKIKPIKPIIKVNTNEELDTEEGESNTHEQESTISNNNEDEYSTFSDMSKQDSESDINVGDTQYQENSYTPELQVDNTYNTTMHDKDNSIHEEYITSENEHTIEIETIEQYGEEIHETQESISTEAYLNHQKRIGIKKLENRTNSLLPNSKLNIQEIGKQDQLCTTKFQIENENRNVEGLITDSTDQQIFKFKVNFWGVNMEFSLYQLKWTIHAILQHMGFNHTTENPCVIIREKHKTKSCEYIIIHQDELYIASSTIKEILHIVKDKYEIKIILKDYQ